MSANTKTALITGVSGQDGPYLAELLIKNGYRVIGTIRNKRYSCTDSFKFLSIENRITFEELDLLDVANVIRIVQKYKPDEIYNLAAQSSVGLSFTQPVGTFSFNTTSVNNLLETIRLFAPSTKLYQASSSEMYGYVKHLPIAETTEMHPVSPYAVSKMAAHFMVINYRESYNIFACNGILFNHESVLRSDNFFVKKVVKEAVKIKRGEQDRLVIGNLDIKRDFGFAPTYVEAMWLMMQKEAPDDYIICTGTSILLRDIVHYVFDKLGLDHKLIYSDAKYIRPNEIFEISGDNSKAKKVLSWNNDISFYEVLDLMIDFELKLS